MEANTKIESKSDAQKKEKISYDSPLVKKTPNVISRLFFFWMFPIFYNGMSRDLEEYDLVPARRHYDSKRVGDRLEKYWALEEVAAKANGREPSITRALYKSFWMCFIPGGIMHLISVGMRTFTPLLLTELLKFWSVKSTMSRETAAMYAGCMVVSYWIAAFFTNHGNLYNQQLGMKLRTACSSLIFRKIMRMNSTALHDTAAGQVVNILSNDMERFDQAMLYFHLTWILGLQLVAVAWLGYSQVGYAALIGLASLIIIAVPVQGVIGKFLGKVRSRTALKTDERIKVMTEVIKGIQVIKMYAWEIPFQKVVDEKRANELKQVKLASVLRIFFRGLTTFIERTSLFFTMLPYIFFGNTLSANLIYSVQQFLNVAQIYVTQGLPQAVSTLAELRVSLDRIQSFLVSEDRSDLVASSPLYNTQGHDKSETVIRPLSYNKKCNEFSNNADFKPFLSLLNRSNFAKGAVINKTKSRKSWLHPENSIAVEFCNVSASWSKDLENCSLKHVSMKLRRGKLCAIIGAVGSGKSSLLQMLLKELPALEGTVSIYGSCAYASQDAWLFSSTVRQNILFGMPFDEEKYKKVCRVCCLEKDFKQFPYSDQTLVGERGVSLSGGQRARINLARSVYREADIYLLDDPLSAVDANVGRMLFEGCINGYLRGRTRILVTHQTHFLKDADHIVVLNDGRVEKIGTFDELIKLGNKLPLMVALLQAGKDKHHDSFGSEVETKRKVETVSKRSKSIGQGEAEDIKEFEVQELQAEERQSGDLKWSVVSTYFRSGGNVWFITFAMIMIQLSAAIGGAVDYWVSFWFNNISKYEKSLNGGTPGPGLDVQVGPFTTGQYLIIHGVLVLACIITTQMRIIPFVTFIMRASKNLHDYMFSTMLTGVMSFFNTTPSGRMLNRFTKDMGAIDDTLPRVLLDVLQICGIIVTVLVLNAISLYWTIIPSLILLLIFTCMVIIYMKTAKSIKRLEGISKSPVFGMVSCSLNGIATIRSAGAQNRLIEDFDNRQNLHTTTWNCYLAGGLSFGLCLDTMCLTYLAVVTFILIYFDFGDLVGVGAVGLIVTKTNMLINMLQFGSRMLVEFFAQLTSVERVLEYTQIETEENLLEGQLALPKDWPSTGRIVFDSVTMRYAPDTAPVLKNLDFVIESGWKVGIIGRTGAGKSSLVSALFRFAFLEGKITIDDIDTSLLGKQEFRSKISIIPQEPVLFSATIRYNLDPFNIYSDADIWQALEQVDMKSAIPSLDFKVTEGGSNFSVGQRQLMCLARAMLRSNRILIMDEATANVDPQTDNFIQETIKRHFASCTVLTIAHRLNTIIESDRVLVMSFGHVVEYDYPYKLLSDPNSHFSSLVRETGEENSAQLIRLAKEAYYSKNPNENTG